MIIKNGGSIGMGSTRDNIFINIDKRLFYIHDFIDEDSMSKVCFNLLEILNDDQERENKEKDFERSPIKIYINSYGGNMDDMWSLVDIILNSKTPIYTYSTSYADSCGFLIFLAGQKRFITKHTKMCCHQFSAVTIGTYQNIKEDIKKLDRAWHEFEEYICSQTKITNERLKEVKDKKLDWYIYPEESIELGVATDIINKL